MIRHVKNAAGVTALTIFFGIVGNAVALSQRLENDPEKQKEISGL